MTRILGNDIENEVAKTVAKMYKPSASLPLTAGNGGAGYHRPAKD